MARKRLTVDSQSRAQRPSYLHHALGDPYQEFLNAGTSTGTVKPGHLNVDPRSWVMPNSEVRLLVPLTNFDVGLNLQIRWRFPTSQEVNCSRLFISIWI